MKKYLLKFLTVICMLCLCLGVFTACGNGGGTGEEPFVTDGVVYAKSEDQTFAYVVDYTGEAKRVEILSTYESLPVTQIGFQAFYYARELTHVKIPDSIEVIGREAFKWCEQLVEVTIPNGVTDIETEAFGGCGMLNSINIPNTVEKIGLKAFYSCDSLTELKVPQSVTLLEYNAFENCPALTLYAEVGEKPEQWPESFYYSMYESKYVPIVWDYKNNDTATDGYKYAIIDGIRYALKDSVASVAVQPKIITQANVPQTVVYKGDTYTVGNLFEQAFSGCMIESATIPSSVSTLPYKVFGGCMLLSEVNFSNSIHTICTDAFFECLSLTEVVIPQSVTTMEYSSVRSSPALTVYCEATTRPGGWHEEWDYENRHAKVWNCKENEIAEDGNIYKVIDGVKYALKGGVATVVGQPANVVDVVVKASIEHKGQTYAVKTIASYAFYGCYFLNSIVISNGVETIEQYAIYDCYNLTKLVIPQSVKSMSSYTITVHYFLYVYVDAQSDLEGWANNWQGGNVVCYYSETEPTDTNGYYWHYVDGEIVRWPHD